MGEAKNDRIISQGLKNNEPELLESTLLCDGKGNLLASSRGWSRHPLHSCNLSGHWPRKKKWNYWNIASDRYLFCIAVANFDYAAMAFTYLYDYNTNQLYEKTLIVPFARGCGMPDNVREDIHFKNKGMNLSFTEDKSCTKIHVECDNFKETIPLTAEFIIEHPAGLETLNVVIPWDNKRFQYTSKQNCLPAVGTAAIGNEVFYFKSGETFASLDFGRGIWPRRTFWNWATASGIYEGKSIGLNLGGSWTDGTGMTENGILFDGKINKISDDVVFDYCKDNLMKSWSIRTQNCNRIEVEFTPGYDRIVVTNIPFIKSIMHQVFGHFSGSIVLDNGDKINIYNIPGCVEEHNAKW